MRSDRGGFGYNENHRRSYTSGLITPAGTVLMRRVLIVFKEKPPAMQVEPKSFSCKIIVAQHAVESDKIMTEKSLSSLT